MGIIVKTDVQLLMSVRIILLSLPVVLCCLVMFLYRQEWFVDDVIHGYMWPICSDVCYLPVNCLSSPRLQSEIDELRTTLTAVREEIVAIPLVGDAIFHEMLDKRLLHSDNLYHELRKLPEIDRYVFQGRIKALMELIHDDTPLLDQFIIQKKEIALELAWEHRGLNRLTWWAVRVDDYQFLISHFPHLKPFFGEPTKPQYDNKGAIMYQLHPFPGGFDPPPHYGAGAMPVPNARNIDCFNSIPHATRGHGARLIILYRESLQ